MVGAGISTGSGIPDFRSTEGLFATLKAQYPEAKLTSGKDLFDASLFSVSDFFGILPAEEEEEELAEFGFDLVRRECSDFLYDDC